MILVDTNIIIDYWRNPTDKIRSVFINNEIAICGVVKAELVHGAKSDKDAKSIINALQKFPEIIISNNIWEKIGLNLYKLKTNGLVLPFQDIIIATLALENSCEIWTNDKHFKSIANVLVDLKLFES